jgi:hypothetical protein
MDTLYANAADYSAKASGHLGLEQPREANTNQNDVIHLLMRVINQVHSELRLSQIESAMNEQAQARIQRMILRQKMCLVETKSVWDGRGGDGVYSRSARMRIEEIAKEQKGIQADADVVWEIINTAHAVGYNCFPAEARLMMEMARLEMQMAEKRLTAVDPGEETQRIEESIIARLKKTESMCAMEIPGGAKETDVKFTFGVMLTRPPINSFQRAPILAMLLAIQEDIATRTQRVSASRRAGNTDPGLDAEMEQLRQLQENVLAQLNQYAREDARAFGGPDSMATQYGTVTGGTKATYVGRGGH